MSEGIIKKLKYKKLIAILLIAICFGLVTVLGYFGFDYYKSYKVVQTFDSEKYEQAFELHKNHINGMSENRLSRYNLRLKNQLDDRAVKVKDDYKNEIIDYDEAEYILEEIKKFLNSKELIQEIQHDIKEINNSRLAYDAGNKHLDNNEYLLAVIEFHKVIKSDTSYFESAQNKSDLITSDAKDDLFKVVENHCSNNEYDAAIYLLNTFLNIVSDSETEEILVSVREEQKKHKEKRKEKLLAKLNKHKDPVDKNVTYAPKPHKASEFNIPLDSAIFYPILKGEYGDFVLMLRTGFNRNDWVFMEKIVVNADDNIFDINFTYSERQSHVGFGTGVYEWVHIAVFKDIIKEFDINHNKNLLEHLIQLSEAKNVKIKFSGSSGNHYYDLTKKDKQAFKDVIELYLMQL